MTSRRLIRIKVLQLLYAYSKKENVTIAELERDLLQSMSKSTDLYYTTLLLLTEIRRKAFLKIDAARNRRFNANHPDTRFISNPIFDIIEKNQKFQQYILNNKISWNDDQETIVYFYNKLLQWPTYQMYMQKEDISFDTHKQLVLDMFTELIAQDDIFFQMLEDKNLYWNDDFEVVLSVVYKTLRHLQPETQPEDTIVYPIYKTGEDETFGRTLMRKAVLEYEENIQLIDQFTRNWELERISDMDKYIMTCAVSELKNFPTIPVKVTLDEYIEISKTYSSPKSGAFINGILDKIVNQLKENNQLTKMGRGLVDQSISK